MQTLMSNSKFDDFGIRYEYEEWQDKLWIRLCIWYVYLQFSFDMPCCSHLVCNVGFIVAKQLGVITIN